MSEYVILTDSACDIHDDVLAEWGVDYRELVFKFNDDETISIEYKKEWHL